MGNIQSNRAYMGVLDSLLLWIEQEQAEQATEEAELRRRHDSWRERQRNRQRDRGYALRETEFLSSKTFSRMFRMSRDSFEKLLDKVSPLLHDTDEVMAERSSGAVITKRTKLHANLRCLAGGSYLDICFAWGLAEGTFYDDDVGVMLRLVCIL